jgi:hypothetical protein
MRPLRSSASSRARCAFRCRLCALVTHRKPMSWTASSYMDHSPLRSTQQALEPARLGIRSLLAPRSFRRSRRPWRLLRHRTRRSLRQCHQLRLCRRCHRCRPSNQRRACHKHHQASRLCSPPHRTRRRTHDRARRRRRRRHRSRRRRVRTQRIRSTRIRRRIPLTPCTSTRWPQRRAQTCSACSRRRHRRPSPPRSR